jgi:hypothetical protein
MQYAACLVPTSLTSTLQSSIASTTTTATAESSGGGGGSLSVGWLGWLLLGVVLRSRAAYQPKAAPSHCPMQ